MTGPEFRAIRQQLDLTQEAWGRALGFTGANIRITVNQIEAESKTLTSAVERLAWMYGKHGIPKQYLSD